MAGILLIIDLVMTDQQLKSTPSLLYIFTTVYIENLITPLYTQNYYTYIQTQAVMHIIINKAQHT